MLDPSGLTAIAAAAMIRDGRLSAEALMEACLNRIKAREPELRAFAWLDPEASRRAVCEARSGPLHGLPLGV